MQKAFAKKISKKLWLRKRKILVEEKKLAGEAFYFFHFCFFSSFPWLAFLYPVFFVVWVAVSKYSFDSCFDFYLTDINKCKKHLQKKVYEKPPQM